MHGRFKGLGVTHLAHQHDVGILADGVLQGDLEILHVQPHLTLVDQTLIGRKNKFNRVLNGQDVFAIIVVDPVQHGRDRRALAASRHAGQKDHSLVVFAQVLDARWEVQPREVRDEPFDFARNHPPMSLLDEEIDAETPSVTFIFDHVSEVSAAVLEEDSLAALVQHG